MIKFEDVGVYNILNAIRGMRNSYESWDKSDSYKVYNSDISQYETIIGKDDYKLAMKLSKAGRGHDKFLRQILISVDISAPEYWWKEADTYKVATVANSTSMMHTLGKNEIEVTAFSFDEPDHSLVNLYMGLIKEARERWAEAGKIRHSRCPHWRLLNQLMAISFIYKRTFTANYGVLKGMYHDRKNHRLSEWHEFAAWVETLPYSELITFKDV